jgi:hypothetical protein
VRASHANHMGPWVENRAAFYSRSGTGVHRRRSMKYAGCRAISVTIV